MRRTLRNSKFVHFIRAFWEYVKKS